MAENSIPVDLLNPGQVLACMGLVEAAEVLLGGAVGIFDWSRPGGARFLVRANGEQSPVEEVLLFLGRARAFGEAPRGSGFHSNWKNAWGQLTESSKENVYPFAAPRSPATIRCIIADDKFRIPVDYWGESTERTGRDNVKFWAGSGGYPGSALARDALDAVRGQLADAADDPFSVSAPQSSSFRLDWRRDYIPLDAGFSLNEHGNFIESVGFPLVELLAAIGLQHARPLRPDRRDKLVYTYAVPGLGDDSELRLPPVLLRAALGGSSLPFRMRKFRVQLNWPGQENQARAITTVTEEIAQ